MTKLRNVGGSAPASWGGTATDDGVPVAGLVTTGVVLAAGGAGAYALVRRRRLQHEEEQREALHLVAIEDLSYQEAASALGIPVGTLMSRIARARASLRHFEEATSKVSHLRLIEGGGNENR